MFLEHFPKHYLFYTVFSFRRRAEKKKRRDAEEKKNKKYIGEAIKYLFLHLTEKNAEENCEEKIDEEEYEKKKK